MPGRLHFYTVKMKPAVSFGTPLTTYWTRRHPMPRYSSPHNFRVRRWIFEDFGAIVCSDAHENLQMSIHVFLRLSSIFLSHISQLKLSIFLGLSYILWAIWKSVRRVIHLHFCLNILNSLWCGSVFSANYLSYLVSTVVILHIFCYLASWCVLVLLPVVSWNSEQSFLIRTFTVLFSGIA
jgi:hypothetical protein